MEIGQKVTPTTAPRYGVLALCRNRAGYEAAPERPLSLDLAAVADRLRGSGHEILGNAGVLLAVRVAGVDASVFESGKVLFKTRDAVQADLGMRAFRAAMGW